MAFLSACGGGGDGANGAPPSPLPEVLSIAAPAAGDLAAAVQFASNASNAAGLRYEWNFGDGSSSTEASPKHAYAKAGDYEVQLKLSNEAGQSRSSSFKLSLSNKAHLAGRICSGTDAAGWCWQAPLPAGAALTQASFVTDQLGWALTDEQQLSKTSDGGRNWQALRLPDAGKLHSFALVDANTAWVLGADGQVWRSDDGGASFRRVGRLSALLGSSSLRYHGGDLLSVTSVSADLATTSLWVSADGGHSWFASTQRYDSLAKDGSLYRTEWTGDGMRLQVMRSLDLGLHESVVGELPGACQGGTLGGRLIQAASRSELLSVSWQTSSSNEGGWQHFVDQAVLCASTDGGQTWKRAAAAGIPQLLYSRYSLRGDVAFWPAGGGQYWASVRNVGWGGAAMYRSVDGGESWTAVAAPESGVSVRHVASASTLLGANDYGGAWVSSDAGASWQALKVGQGGLPETLSSLAGQGVLLSGRSSVADYDKGDWQLLLPRFGSADLTLGFGGREQVGTIGSAAMPTPGRLFAYSGSQLLRSSDYGRSWQAPPLFAMGQAGSLQFASASTGWAVADFGLLFRTRDGGASWSKLWEVPVVNPAEFAGSIQALQFTSESEGLMMVSDWRTSTLQHSSDGGQSWKPITSLSIYAKQLLALGGGDVLLAGTNGTRPGGLFLVKTDSNEVTNVYGLDSELGMAVNRLHRQSGGKLWAVGSKGLVLSSADAGKTWLRQDVGASGGLNDIQFADALHGWIVGDAGLVLASDDGGKSWKPQAQLTQRNLQTLLIQDAKTIWAFGENGTVLATGTGGF
jgi:photosystem II stability/assembly factor-like uncharacterized protein